jgi:hypothetical protein
MDQEVAEARSEHGGTVPPGTARTEGAETGPESPSSPGSPAAHGASDAHDCREHPGIGVRPGPTGPRAGLLDGPDVWEVVAALRALQDEDPARHGESLRKELCDVTGLTVVQVSAVLDYYAAHPEDVDERVAYNDEAALRVQSSATGDEPSTS